MNEHDNQPSLLPPVGDTEETPKPIDPCWEALVRETAANPAMERGQLNVALRAIRQAAFSEGLTDDTAVAHEILLRAQAYRDRMPQCSLTPTALAKHWFRVMVNPATQSTQQTALQQARMQP